MRSRRIGPADGQKSRRSFLRHRLFTAVVAEARAVAPGALPTHSRLRWLWSSYKTRQAQAVTTFSRLFPESPEGQTTYQVFLQGKGENDYGHGPEGGDGRNVAPKHVVSFHER